MPTAADFIVERLRRAGVRALFGVPGGGGNLDLIAAAGRAGLPFVLTATETAGAIAAIAQAEITGEAGACLTTLGPGAASVVNGVACAFLDRATIFVFTDTYASTGADAFQHQRLDHRALFAGITIGSVTLDPQDIWRSLDDAFGLATLSRRGPIHIDCPADFAGARTDGDRSRFHVVTDDSLTMTIAGSRLGSRDDLLARSRRPLALVGLGARSPEDVEGIRNLCESHGVPAMVTYKAKGVIADDHPWFSGVFTNAAIDRPLIDECDLIIGFGLDRVELLPRQWKPSQPAIYFEDRNGIAEGLRAAEALLPPSTWDAGAVRAAWDAQRRAIMIDAPGLTAQHVVQIAADTLAADSRVTVDAGAHMFAATMLWPVREPNGMLISNGLSTMGFALPAAIGAAHLDRTRRVVALTGDGGLLMCVGELLTAVRDDLPIVTIVFADASLSLIEIKQQQRKLPASGVALGEIDWVALAGSVGMRGWPVSDAEELRAVLEQARSHSGPCLIEARIDRSNYSETMRAIRG
jgi:acetolactate synthase I/II/III large subunit